MIPGRSNGSLLQQFVVLRYQLGTAMIVLRNTMSVVKPIRLYVIIKVLVTYGTKHHGEKTHASPAQ